MSTDNIRCGVIGYNGYLGQQLKMYNHCNEYALTLIQYDRSTNMFILDEEESSSIDVILDLGTPNEVVARSDPFHADQSLNEWNRHLIYAVEQAKPSKLVHFSTLHIFGRLKGEITEKLPFLGGNPYGDLHISALKIIRDLCVKNCINECVIIPSNIYGSIDKDHIGRTNLILNLAIDCALKGKPLQLASNGKGLRDFLWIEDLLRFLVITIMDDVNDNPLFLVASGTTSSIAESLRTIHHNLCRGNFDDWVTFGESKEIPHPFSVSINGVSKYLNDWKPLSISDAMKRIAEIHNISYSI